MKTLIPLIFKDDRVLLKQIDGIWTPPTSEFSFSQERELPQQTNEVTKNRAGIPTTFASLTDVIRLDDHDTYIAAVTTTVEETVDGWEWRPLSLLPDRISIPPETIKNAARILRRVQKNLDSTHPFFIQLQRAGEQYLEGVQEFLDSLRKKERPPSTVEWQDYTDLLTEMLRRSARYGVQHIYTAKQSDLPDDVEKMILERSGTLSDSQRQKLEQLIQSYVESGLTWEEAFQKALDYFRNVNVYATAMTEPNFAFHQAATITAVKESVDYAVYHTARDERVCPVCAPREGRLVRVGTSPYYETLPAIHPHCRCWMLFYTSLEEVQSQEGINAAEAATA